MKNKFAVLVVALLIAGAAGYFYLSMPTGLVSTRAVVEGQLVPVTVAVSGQVREVYVAAGQAVAEGQPLFALDKSGHEARLAKERARLAEIAATLPGNLAVPSPTGAHAPRQGKPLAALRAEESEARAAVEVAAGVLASANIALSRTGGGAAEYAPTDPKRQAALIARDEAAISLNRAKEAFEKASYARAQREAQDKNEAAGGTMSAALAARVAEYQAQISRVRLAEQDLAATVVVAPESGRVAIQTALPGNAVAPGDTPVAILPDKSRGVWVMAFFPKTAGDKLVPGTVCEVSFAADDGNGPRKGRVDAVFPSPDAEKDIAVRVILDQNDEPLQIAPGKEATVTVAVGGKFAVPGRN